MASTHILRSNKVVTPDGVKQAAIHCREGKIITVTSHDEISQNVVVEEFGDLVIMPGLVDTHVHINEPGRTEWEGFETATKAAAAGGITTLIEMPLNSSPVTTAVEAFRKKCSVAEGKLYIDCGFYGGLIPGNTDQIEPLIEAGVFGIKAFLIHSGIDEFPNVTESDLRNAMPVIAKHNMPLLVHCELTDERFPPSFQNPKSYSEYLQSRPRKWEDDAIARMIRLAEEYHCKVHIVHVSSSDAIPILERARAQGLPVTTETCPHYLYFTAVEIPDGDTRFKCAPPIRERENKEKLWDALKNGVLDFIVSDHSPSPPSMKFLDTGDFQRAWGGIASLQFGLSIVWTEARKRGFKVSDLARWMSHNPAKFVGLENHKGAIAPGHDADFVVWNPNQSFIVQPSTTFHRHKITPYEGKELFGAVVATFLRGDKVFDGGEIIGKPAGTVLTQR